MVKNMDKKSNVRVVSFPIDQYDREWLDTLKDEELSSAACAEGESQIWSSLEEFQNDINSDRVDFENNWFYFLND